MTDRIRTGPASLASSRAEPLTLRSHGWSGRRELNPRFLRGRAARYLRHARLEPARRIELRLHPYRGCVLPLPLGRHELGAQDSDLNALGQSRAGLPVPLPPMRAPTECHPRLAVLARDARSLEPGRVRSAGPEPAITRPSTVPVCQLRHERKRAATRGRTGPSAVRRRSRKPCAAAKLGYQASNLEGQTTSAQPPRTALRIRWQLAQMTSHLAISVRTTDRVRLCIPVLTSKSLISSSRWSKSIT